MKPVTPRKYLLSLSACLLVLLILLALSPGIGTTSSSFGWWDAWRARLGIEIPASELTGRPLVDVDGDGAISEEERTGFVELSRYIGFEQRFPRTLLALQVGITLALCGATFQTLFATRSQRPIPWASPAAVRSGR